MPGFVVVDTLRTALGGGDYADALLRDPDTGSRVVSFSRAMTLLDIRHAALEIRGKHYLKRAAPSAPQSAQKFIDNHFGGGRAGGPTAKKPRQEPVAQAAPAAAAPFGAKPQRPRRAERPAESDEEKARRYATKFAGVRGVTYESLLARFRDGHCCLCGSSDEDHANNFSRHCTVFRRWVAAQGPKNGVPQSR